MRIPPGFRTVFDLFDVFAAFKRRQHVDALGVAAAGLKGGEIVPTFCIGACFGCVVGAFLGLDPALSGALGLVGLFCSVTNSPIASIFLSVEMFGGGNIYLFAIVCVVSFVLSGHSGLYASQILRFDKVLRRAGRSKEE